MTYNYEQAKEKIRQRHGLTERELQEKIYLAQQWHNPLNYDDGAPIKEHYGWNTLFTDELEKAGYGKRFYFPFKSLEDPTDATEVFIALLTCDNWNRYKKLWSEKAPKEIRAPWVYLLAITEITTKGYKNKHEALDRLEGKQLFGQDELVRNEKLYDFSGVDGVLNGSTDVQIKSPATSRAMGKNI